MFIKDVIMLRGEMVLLERSSENRQMIAESSSLSLVQLGYQECESKHSFGPAIRDYFLCHYVVKGCGNFSHDDELVQIRSGQCFMIYPEEVTYYQADDKEPWTYYWFAFRGSDAVKLIDLCGFSKKNRVLKIQDGQGDLERSMKVLIDIRLKEESDKLFELGQLYRLFHLLRKQYESSVHFTEREVLANRHIRMSIDYIERYFTTNMTIQDVADYVNLDRSQLFKIFKRHFQISPKGYLIQIRMDRARNLLVTTELPIKSIAYSVGYQDPYVFSKVFKQQNKVSPKHFRLNNGYIKE